MVPAVLQQYGLAAIAFYAVCVVIVATVVYQERDPSTTLAWVLVFLLVPVLGIVLYVLFGRDLRLAGANDRRRIAAEASGREAMSPVYARASASTSGPAAYEAPIVARLARAIRTLSGTEPLPCTDLSILPDTGDMFELLYRDIESAEDHVHLEYYIWEDDELTRRFCALLARKARAGVEVRVLYDWMGSLRYGKRQFREMRDAGAGVRADAAHVLRLNYRNHRKMAVIDGRIAYTGGVNFGQEYIDGGSRFESWRDTSVRFTGPLVAELQRLFAVRWMREAGEALFSARYFPPTSDEPQPGAVWGHVVYSGPESPRASIREALLIAIASARQRVRVQSPYFVPDQGVADALTAQALAGTDVEIMMAGVHDKRLPWWAAFTYIDDLLGAGGRVYHYQRGFFHPKTMTVDGSIAVIGTTNLDIRSFRLHEELSVFFYDAGVAAAQDAAFDADRAACLELTAAGVAGLPRPIRFRNALARLTSRML